MNIFFFVNAVFMVSWVDCDIDFWFECVSKLLVGVWAQSGKGMCHPWFSGRRSIIDSSWILTIWFDSIIGAWGAFWDWYDFDFWFWLFENSEDLLKNDVQLFGGDSSARRFAKLWNFSIRFSIHSLVYYIFFFTTFFL